MADVTPTVSLYVVKGPMGYFAGYDAIKGVANFVEEATEGKMFTNKFDIKLRPEEMLVELTVQLLPSNIIVSEPFRPQRRRPKNN